MNKIEIENKWEDMKCKHPLLHNFPNNKPTAICKWCYKTSKEIWIEYKQKQEKERLNAIAEINKYI